MPDLSESCCSDSAPAVLPFLSSELYQSVSQTAFKSAPRGFYSLLLEAQLPSSGGEGAARCSERCQAAFCSPAAPHCTQSSSFLSSFRALLCSEGHGGSADVQHPYGPV